MEKNNTILILHHNADTRCRLANLLARHGVRGVAVSDFESLEGRVEGDTVAAAVIPIEAGTDSSIDRTLSTLRRGASDIRVIALVPSGDAASTRAAFRAGAWDCLEESFGADELLRVIDDARRTPLFRTGAAAAPDLRHGTFLESLAAFRGRCRRQGEPLTVMMLDLDRFRDCNDRYCPTFGNRVLEWFAMTLGNVCRRSDIVAPYGSDRFIVALPGSPAEQALRLARRCRGQMRRNPVVYDGESHEITVSIGVAESTSGFIESEQQLIRHARIALDHAKHQGGNRIVSWHEIVGEHALHRDLTRVSVRDVTQWRQRVRQQLRSTYLESTRALAAAVEAKDPFTRTHCMTVAGYAETISRRMKLRNHVIGSIRAAALLHDIGKIGVPDAILTKPSRLTDEEFDVIKRHPETALDILGHVSFLADERPLILHHHERYDGNGYPYGLGGDRIPIGARVLALADAIDAMFSSRSYKPAYDTARVRSELHNSAGRQFDPDVTEVALDCLDDGSIMAIVEEPAPATPAAGAPSFALD